MKTLATVALCVWAGLASAGPAELSVDQMRAFGMAAVTQGYADQAMGIAEALLQRDAGDSAGWLLKAQALRLQGDLPGSALAARQAWATASDKPARYQAATALAQALSLQGQRLQAQYWLRQAVQNAPTGATQRQAVQDFNYVRGENPISLQFSGSVRPSDNVNGGGKFDLVQIGPFILPLPSTLLQLSGTSWAAGLSGKYRLSDDGQRQTALTFGVNVQGVALTDAAKAKAPDLANGDFLYRQVQIGWQSRKTHGWGRVTTDLSLGHSWYGDADLADSLAAAVALDHALTPDLGLHLAADVTRQLHTHSFDDSSTSLGLTGSLAKTYAKGGQIEVSLDLARVASKQPGTDRTEAGLALQWQAAHPVLGLGLGASLSGRQMTYANGRNDRRLAGGLTATVNSITYLGFSPVLSLDVAHNQSTVPWFTSDTVALGLSLKSRF